MPGVERRQAILDLATASTCVINVQASKEKQEVLHDLYSFIMSDLLDCWKATAPLHVGPQERLDGLSRR